MNIKDFCEGRGFEVVESHMFQDIIRIELGVIMYVDKYKRDDKFGFCSDFWDLKRKHPKKFKKLTGVPNSFVFTEDSETSYEKIPIPKGTYVFDGNAVIPTKNPDEYTFGLAMNNRYSGDAMKLVSLSAKISAIIAFYR
jgi:hypothetical protein